MGDLVLRSSMCTTYVLVGVVGRGVQGTKLLGEELNLGRKFVHLV